ncbi:unnamed protein product [Ectocarpus fasciculatus]
MPTTEQQVYRNGLEDDVLVNGDPYARYPGLHKSCSMTRVGCIKGDGIWSFHLLYTKWACLEKHDFILSVGHYCSIASPSRRRFKLPQQQLIDAHGKSCITHDQLHFTQISCVPSDILLPSCRASPRPRP